MHSPCHDAKREADINAKADDGSTPLIAAVDKDSRELLALEFEEGGGGADEFAQNPDKRQERVCFPL
jgi:hypothetical protein